jgi:acetyl-CoA C-acetyltransferase
VPAAVVVGTLSDALAESLATHELEEAVQPFRLAPGRSDDVGLADSLYGGGGLARYELRGRTDGISVPTMCAGAGQGAASLVEVL